MSGTAEKWPKRFSHQWWVNRKRALGSGNGRPRQFLIPPSERDHYHITRSQMGEVIAVVDRPLFYKVIEVEVEAATHECSPECPCGRMTDEERQRFFPS